MRQKEVILEQLKAMGFEPVELGDIGYAFKYEDLTYLYMPDEDDEQFLRITIPHLCDVTEEKRREILEAVHETGLMLKYAKVCIMYDATWAVYEHRLRSTEDLTELLEHMIWILEAAADVFYKKLNGEEVNIGLDQLDGISDEELEEELEKMLESIEDEE